MPQRTKTGGDMVCDGQTRRQSGRFDSQQIDSARVAVARFLPNNKVAHRVAGLLQLGPNAGHGRMQVFESQEGKKAAGGFEKDPLLADINRIIITTIGDVFRVGA